MRVRLYHSIWPLVDGASLVNPEQLADSTEKLALENSPLVRENLEGAPETKEELIDRSRDGNLSRLGGQRDAFHPLGDMVHHQQDKLITALGKGPRKPRG